MAAGYLFTCDTCGYTIEAWDEGNPYILDLAGKRHYFFHPSGDRVIQDIGEQILGYRPEGYTYEALEAYLGNAGDYICRDCGRKTKRDPRCDSMVCTGCKGTELVDVCTLGGTRCLKCEGTFGAGKLDAIS